MAKCSICQNEKYSIRMNIRYKSCFGCNDDICLDCFVPDQACRHCKSEMESHIIDTSILNCTEMDKKFGPFECPTCKEKIERHRYYIHNSKHTECKCAKKCAIVELKCKKTASKCRVYNHSEKCSKCRDKYCELCNEQYINKKHKKIMCECENGTYILCQQTNTTFINHICTIFYELPDKSKQIGIRNYCANCGYYYGSFAPNKIHNCNTIMKTIEDYQNFQRLKESLKTIMSGKNAVDIIEPKFVTNTTSESSYQKIPASSQK